MRWREGITKLLSLIFMLFFSLIMVSWIHTKSKLINFYILNMRNLLYANHISIKLLKTKITVTSLFTVLLLSRALCWLRHSFGMEFFLVMNVYFRTPKSSPDICVPHSKPYPHSTRHIHLSLNLKNDSGSAFAIIWFPIFPNWVLHSL